MVALKFDVGRDFLRDDRREFVVSGDMKRVWAVEIDLLVEFDRICKLLGVKWFIDGGSLLGAVRHRGFVPWDDDIDVCLFREDYERLCDSASAFESPYFLQTYKTDLGFAWGHAVLRNSDTTAIPKGDFIGGFSRRRYNQGISIDIFPMDNIPDGEECAARFLKGVDDRISAVRNVRALLDWREDLTLRSFLTPHGIRRSLAYAHVLSRYALGRRDPLRDLADEHDRYVRQHNTGHTNLCCTIAHWPIRRPAQYYRREWFEDVVYLDFEMLKVPAPVGYEDLLEGLYGDWRKHVVGASLHGGMFYDADRPYRDYQRASSERGAGDD